MIISLSGPSGIGKGYVKVRLLQSFPAMKELAWLTTRPLRQNESGNRVSVPQAEFDELASAGELVLVQSLYGHRYGLRKQDLLSAPGVFITELHPDNIQSALAINPDIFAVGLITFDYDFLRRRLSEIRMTESEGEISQRVNAARLEVRTILQLESLFEAIIQVTEVHEFLTFNYVFAVLAPHIEKGA